MSFQVLLGQLLVGLINGSFYAMMSLGLAIIFGLLNIANIAQGAFYMMGAFFSWMLLRWYGIGYFPALVLVPLGVGIVGMAIERLVLARIYKLDHIYGLLLTFGILMFTQGLFVWIFATAGRPYPVPPELQGGFDLGFMFLPKYRAWVVVASLTFCLVTWLIIEKTPIGRTLRAATENPNLTRAFGVNVPALMTFGFGVGVALAGAAGLLAAPIYSVSPLMGGDLVIVVFAIVVVGGMQSILGAVITGLSLGLLEGLTKFIYAPAANMVIFVIMFIVLLVKPAGLFGHEK
jgi:branched-chain amino acid transport system permease protein